MAERQGLGSKIRYTYREIAGSRTNGGGTLEARSGEVRLLVADVATEDARSGCLLEDSILKEEKKS